MIEALHRIGSRIRRSSLLAGQRWLWKSVEPSWQRLFERLTRHHGFPTYVNDDIFRLLYAHGARYDSREGRMYEPAIYQAFTQRIKKGMRVFDIGAHIGLYTLGAATRVGSAGRVYAFEPSPETDRILRRHINLNGCQDRVEIVNAVVSDVVGVVPFYVHGLTMAASLGRENVDELSPEKHDTPALKIEVPSLTLDQFCKDRNIRPDMLKIDVEGAELLVLRGASGLLRGEPPIILCEIHPQEMRYCGSSLPQLFEFLDGLGYCATPLDAPNALGIFHSLITRRSVELRQ